MDSIDSQLALSLVDNIEFEEKVDIETLVLPSKPTNIPKTEFNDTEKEMLENAKPLSKEINPLALVAWLAAFSGPILIGISALIDGNTINYLTEASLNHWIIAFYIGFIMQPITYGCFYYVLKNNHVSFAFPNGYVDSEKIITSSSRDTLGNTKKFDMEIIVTLIKSQKGKANEKVIFSENFKYNNTSNKFDLKKYEKNIQQNLTNIIFQEMLLYLSSI